MIWQLNWKHWQLPWLTKETDWYYGNGQPGDFQYRSCFAGIGPVQLHWLEAT